MSAGETVSSKILLLRLAAFVSLLNSVLMQSKNYSYSFTPDLSMSWRMPTVAGTGYIVLQINKQRPGWAGVGFGQSMSKAEIVLVQTMGGSLTVQSCFLTGHVPPNCNMVQGWQVMNSSITPNGFTVTVNRTLMKVDQANGINIASGDNSMLYAMTDNPQVQLHEHNAGSAFGSILIDLSTDQEFNPDGTKWGFLRHEYVQVIIWTALCDILIVLARYLKMVPYWQDIHSYTFLLALIVSYISRNTGQTQLAAVDFTAYDAEHTKVSRHKLLALIFLYVGIVQLLLGMLNNILRRGYLRSHVKSSTARQMHRYFGVGTWLLARVIVFIGAYLYWVKFEASWIFWLVLAETGLIAAGVTTVEIWNITKRRGKGKLGSPLLEADSPLMEIIEDIKVGISASTLKTKYPGYRLVVYRDGLYDMDGFDHPGGKAMIDYALFLDISRYILGICGRDSTGESGHRHSKEAEEILEKRFVASIWEGRDKGPKQMIIENKQKISTTTTLFSLSTPNFTTEALPPVLSLGHHFILSLPSQTPKSRLYTNCSTLSPEYITYERAMVKYCRERRGEMPRGVEKIGYLPLVIKEYASTDGVSGLLHRAAVGSEVTVEGPVGTGFALGDLPEGRIVIVCGGTGILPFIDLLSAILLQTVHSILSIPCPLTPPTPPVSLYCSFRTIDDYIGREKIENILSLAREYGLSPLECTLRIDEGGEMLASSGVNIHKGYFDKPTLSQTSLTKDIARVYICGPPQMQRTIFSVFTGQMGVHADRIIYA
jgi:NAD(P)H-flavin reductase